MILICCRILKCLRKYVNFSTLQTAVFMEMHLFWKNLLAIRPKLCGNCAFSQHFHTRKLRGAFTRKLRGVTIFYAVPLRTLNFFSTEAARLCFKFCRTCFNLINRSTASGFRLNEENEL